MNPIVALAFIALLLIIRLAVPCAVIGGFCFLIDRLYKRWDDEVVLKESMIAPK